MTPEEFAILYYATYEHLASVYDYKKNRADVVPWERLPVSERDHRIETARHLLDQMRCTTCDGSQFDMQVPLGQLDSEGMFRLASQACYAYRELYDTFPLRIGVHPCWNTLRWSSLTFPIAPALTAASFFTPGFDPTITPHLVTHVASFVIRVDKSVKKQHVWLYHPNATDWIASETVFMRTGRTRTGERASGLPPILLPTPPQD